LMVNKYKKLILKYSNIINFNKKGYWRSICTCN
jgi:hypothetical protein